MESSSNNCGAADIPKRNRSLDLKSLYESRVSRVREAKKDVSDGFEHENVKKIKRKSKKEFPLSFFQSDAKRAKEGVNGVKLEQKSSSRIQGLNNISSDFSENGAPFVIPRRRRGSIERRKLQIDQVPGPSTVTDSVKHVEASDTANGVADTQEESMLGDNSVGSGTSSAKRVKIGSKLTVNLVSSNAKLNKKGQIDEVTRSASDHSTSPAHDVKVENSHLKLKPTTDPKITVKSRRSKLNSRSNIDASDSKGSSNDNSSSAKGVEKGYTEARQKKRVGKSSDVKSSDSDSKTKVETAGHDLKDQIDVQPTSSPHECSKAVKDGDETSKRPQKRGRKKRNLMSRDSGEASKRKSEPSTGSSVSNNHFTDYLDDEDDNEENLEKSAARMLSSRFDPSCTGYSSRRRYSAFKKPVGSYITGLSTRDSSADDKSRALRSRREDTVKGTRRKRRHFYEILPDDLDPFWVLNQRIKIFWPLDESWYYGLVDEYHSESKLHHIRYDDRDEEWVNLPEEKFKILLLPGDIPSRSKSRKQAPGDKYSNKKQEEGDLLTENSPDSEPIASWLANQPQLAKSSSKALKVQRTSQEQLSVAASMSSGEASDSDAGFFGPTLKPIDMNLISDDAGKLRNFCPHNSSLSNKNLLSGNNLVYVRRRYRNSVLKGSSVSENVKAGADSLVTTKGRKHIGWMNSNMPLWHFDDCNTLQLNDVLMKSNDVRFHIHLPLIRFMEFECEQGASWLAHHTFMLQNGVVVTISPAIILEILFVDNNLGLKLLLYEGYLRQAISFVSIILILFSQSNEHMDGSMGLPVTSIRFRIFSVYDQNKQHVFAFYSFSGLKRAKWLYLESKLLQHCLFIKGLSVLDCTHDNIKELEYGCFQHCKPHPKVLLSSNEYSGSRRKVLPGILPMINSLEADDEKISQSTIPLAAEPEKSPQFALFLSTAPSFFQSLHMQLLTENSFACVSLHQKPDSQVGEPVSECTSLRGLQDCLTEDPASRCSPSYLKDHQMDVGSSGNVSVCHGRMCGCSTDLREHTKRTIEESQDCEAWDASVPLHRTAFMDVTSTSPNLRVESLSSHTIGGSSYEKGDVPSHGEVSTSGQTSDGDWNLHENFVHGSSGFRKLWKRGRKSSLSSSCEYPYPSCSDVMPNFTSWAFSNGPKKPRTHVQYSLPYVGYDFSSKQKPSNSAALPYKRIRRARLKRTSDGNGKNQKIYDLLTCVANILVTQGDKGWREYGANIVLELADHNEWRLSIKLSGVPRYYYKVKHILQPGSTNRYSHAMMWKGGKDWMLEFTGRSQWMLFKEMHEECFNRNIRAASVKNIPIPGVRLVKEWDEQGADTTFTWNSSRYIRQVQNDVEMALDPSRVLYDLDSDDERWLVANNNSEVGDKYEGMPEEFLEKAMDMFEKFSYTKLREEFTNSEVEELVTGLGSVEAGKAVYEYWGKKREKMGMPLVRHLQPPLWERYQHKLKEWGHTVARPNSTFSDGSNERRIPSEKPPMFAFCLKPRGLEVPNRFSKQRSQRKLPVAMPTHASSGNQDSFQGRISNGHAFIDEKALHASTVHYYADVSPSLLASTRDAHFLSSTYPMEWKGPPELSLPKNYYSLGTYIQTKNLQSNLDIHELHMRDESAMAMHARNLAKFKKEKAHRLFCKADLAIHRAVIALMAAEAIRDSSENSSGNN